MASKPGLAAERLAAITRGPLPGSRKIYASGRLHPFIRVPMRLIEQTATLRHGPAGIPTSSPNPSLAVYDTSGPYTDLAVDVDLTRGAAPIRREWLRERGDVAELGEISSEYGRARLRDSSLAGIRFPALRRPLRARTGCAITQMDYARRGVITPEMEFV